MKRFCLMLALVFSQISIFAGDIAWFDSYDKALAKAKSTGQQLLVLITAPSWCYWCQQFETNVLKLSKVQDALNKGFVPLMVLDTSPDISKFSFSGYPTVRVYDNKGTVIKDVYSQKPDYFLQSIEPYSKAVATTTTTTTTTTTDKVDAKVLWEQKTGLFQAGVVDWKNEVKRATNLSVEDAKKMAASLKSVTYFCYTNGPKLTIKGKNITFGKGDVVFFSGEPVLSITAGTGDTFIKIAQNSSEDSDDSNEEVLKGEFKEVANVFQYGGADWSNEVQRESGLTIDEAKEIASGNSEITYFCYVNGKLKNEKGSFSKGDVVFFSGKPWYGSAINAATSFEKLTTAEENKTTQKFTFDNGYFQKLETGLWQGCDGTVCRNYKELPQVDAAWIMISGYVSTIKKDGKIAIPVVGGQAYYWDEKKSSWATFVQVKAKDAFGVAKFGAAPKMLLNKEPETQQLTKKP